MNGPLHSPNNQTNIFSAQLGISTIPYSDNPLVKLENLGFTVLSRLFFKNNYLLTRIPNGCYMIIRDDMNSRFGANIKVVDVQPSNTFENNLSINKFNINGFDTDFVDIKGDRMTLIVVDSNNYFQNYNLTLSESLGNHTIPIIPLSTILADPSRVMSIVKEKHDNMIHLNLNSQIRQIENIIRVIETIPGDISQLVDKIKILSFKLTDDIRNKNILVNDLVSNNKGSHSERSVIFDEVCRKQQFQDKAFSVINELASALKTIVQLKGQISIWSLDVDKAIESVGEIKQTL